jgi:four helix bundle protein
MEERAKTISEKLEDLGVQVVMLCKGMRIDYVGRHISLQLLRSATSVGANYEEGRVAESKSDFIHKLHISLKECRETIYWLRILLKTGMQPEEKLMGIMQQAESASRILAKSIVTAKKSLNSK